MFGPHPLLDLHGSTSVVPILGLVDLSVVSVQIGAEVLQKRHLLLQLLGLVLEVMRGHHVLPVRRSALHLLELLSVWIQDYLGRVVEKHSASAVGQQVPEPVFAAVVNPLAHPHVRPLLHSRPSLALLQVRVLH